MSSSDATDSFLDSLKSHEVASTAKLLPSSCPLLPSRCLHPIHLLLPPQPSTTTNSSSTCGVHSYSLPPSSPHHFSIFSFGSSSSPIITHHHSSPLTVHHRSSWWITIANGSTARNPPVASTWNPSAALVSSMAAPPMLSRAPRMNAMARTSQEYLHWAP